MGLFNFFKKNIEIRPFWTNISDFSEEEITEWMGKVRSNQELLPPSKSDEYVSSLINRLADVKGITIQRDDVRGGVRRILFGIDRGDSPDMAGIEYAQYQPDVVYVTTAMYPFAGMSYMYKQYCMNLESSFPFLQMGARTFTQEIPGIGEIEREAFALRTMVPLLGAEDDYKHLLNALKCLPIYGYDTRDGYPHMYLQPYSGKTGLNIQLEKLVSIYKSKSVSSVIPTNDLIFGASKDKVSEFIMPAYETIETIKKSMTDEDENFMGDNPAGISFITSPLYPSLWIALTMKIYTVSSDDDIENLLSYIGKFSYPSLEGSNFPGIIFLQSWFAGREDDKIGVIYGTVGCCPNEMDIKVMSWQIARFQSLLPD